MNSENNNIDLCEKEKGFLITCIITAAEEAFMYSPRYNIKYTPESGIKYDKISKLEIIDLIRKLGADEDDFEELIGYL